MLIHMIRYVSHLILNPFYYFLSLQPSITTPSLPVVQPLVRDFSSVRTQNPAASAQQDHKIDPYTLLEDDLKDIFEDIRQVSAYIITFLLLFEWRAHEAIQVQEL